MRRILLGFVTGLAFAPASSIAQTALIRACDLAAASPFDRMRPAGVPGVLPGNIDPNVARPACEAALAAAPENPRLLFEAGRAFEAARDDNKARPYFEKAAAQSYAGGQVAIAFFHANGRGGLPKNDQEAARFFQLAAAQGDGTAQAWLAYFYEHGRAFPKNVREAARLYKLAADQGIGTAQYNLALIYMNGGDGVPQNNQEAARLFKLAAAQGIADAQAKLAIISTQSHGTISGTKVILYADFMTAFRGALSKQVGDIGPYSKDIELISSLASQCPISTPKVGFRQKMGFLRSNDNYYNTTTGRACEMDAVGPGAGAFLPKPFVSGSEPRKLYVYAGAQSKAISPGSEKAAFQIAVFIEPKDRSSLNKKCVEGGPWNDILSLCMQLIIDGMIIPAHEIVVAKQRAEEARQRRQASEAAAAKQRETEAEIRAGRELEEAALAALSARKPIFNKPPIENHPQAADDRISDDEVTQKRGQIGRQLLPGPNPVKSAAP